MYASSLRGKGKCSDKSKVNGIGKDQSHELAKTGNEGDKKATGETVNLIVECSADKKATATKNTLTS